MKNEKLKLAFLGGGLDSVVGSAHYSAINLDNIYELVAGVFSTDKEINKKTAEHYKVSEDRVYYNIDELIEKERKNVDAIIVLTPTDYHKEHVLKIINNHIPVICEKALAVSVREVEEIRMVLGGGNGFLKVIYNYLGYPVVRELRNMIQQGALGKINHIQVEMPQEGFIRVDQTGNPVVPQQWRLKDGLVSKLSLDLGSHLHMFIKYLTGEIPVKVVATNESLGNFPGIIDNVNCIIEYTNNLICNMWYSKIAIGQRNGLKIRVYGSKAAAEWLQEIPEILPVAYATGKRCVLDRGNEEAEISRLPRYTRFKVGHPAGFIEAFANYYYDVASALNQYKRDRTIMLNDCFGIEEAYEGMRLLEAIQRSGKSRQWEKI